MQTRWRILLRQTEHHGRQKADRRAKPFAGHTSKPAGPACHLMSASLRKRPKRCFATKLRDGPTADVSNFDCIVGAARVPRAWHAPKAATLLQISAPLRSLIVRH